MTKTVVWPTERLYGTIKDSNGEVLVLSIDDLGKLIHVALPDGTIVPLLLTTLHIAPDDIIQSRMVWQGTLNELAIEMSDDEEMH